MQQLTLVEKVLWAYGFLQNLCLLIVLLYRGRARSIPAFTALIAFGTFRTLVLFTTIQLAGRSHAYTLVYWYAAALDFLLQVAVVYDVARNCFLRSQGWMPGARARLLLLVSAAPVIGAGLAWSMTPAARRSIDAWDARANLFITVTICLMFSAVMVVSRHVGAGWSSLLLRFSVGLVVWSLVSFVTGTLHSYWRMIDHFSLLESFAGIVYLLVTLYWIVIFWIPDLGLPAPPSRSEQERLRSIGNRLGKNQAGQS